MIEQIWAPWRLQYIESAGKSERCIFCDFPAQGEAHDADNLIVHRSPYGFLILNAFPYSNGHLMVVPFRHTTSMEDYSDEELLDIMKLTRLSLRLLQSAYHPEGFNTGLNIGRVAGAGIANHLHWHIVPRWNGDTNFMTAVSGIRVIPERLENTYKRLRQALPEALKQEKSDLGTS
jgi:ATP adenylyltransferase